MLDPQRIGHTGITWPTQPVEEKVADLAAIGFPAFETFGHVIAQYPGGAPAFKDLLQRHGLRYAASYCARTYIDPARAEEDIAQVMEWARLSKEVGAETIVVSCQRREKETYTPEEYAGLARTLNTLGARLRDELGLLTALHPHTGTPVERPEEIARVVEALDPRACAFGPDTGQIAQAGGDAVEVVRRYSELVGHVHVKDYGGTPVQRRPDGSTDDPTGYVGYVPVGSGVIDFVAMFRDLKETGFKGWLMVELDGTARSPRPPKEAAAMSYRGLTEAVAAANQS
ncbi:MAG TPA: TIM barrel protein [Chloroflexota bacterium]|jgi:inosose dehydratase|nr:TIM barrel protein [Chloroflexota bacterium]